MLRVALQHVEQVLEPDDGLGRARRRFFARGLAQPLQQPHQPQVALGQRRLRVGRVQEGGLRHAQEAPAHGALRRADLCPGAVLEALPRRQHRLVADDGQAIDDLHLAAGVGDLPVAADELGQHVAGVLDRDGVAVRIQTLLEVRLLGQGLNGHGATETGVRHACILPASGAMLRQCPQEGSETHAATPRLRVERGPRAGHRQPRTGAHPAHGPAGEFGREVRPRRGTTTGRPVHGRAARRRARRPRAALRRAGPGHPAAARRAPARRWPDRRVLLPAALAGARAAMALCARAALPRAACDCPAGGGHAQRGQPAGPRDDEPDAGARAHRRHLRAGHQPGASHPRCSPGRQGPAGPHRVAGGSPVPGRAQGPAGCRRRTPDRRLAQTGTRRRAAPVEREIPLKPLYLPPDGRPRCAWCAAAPGDAEYLRYHDEEWGRPVADDVRLFEKLCLEGFQSGLSWRTILNKREAFRAAFAGFDFHRVAQFGAADVARLLADPGIVRHRGKIEAAIHNAGRCVELVRSEGSLAAYLWRFEPPKNSVAHNLSQSAPSEALSKDLKQRGWNPAATTGPKPRRRATPSCGRGASGGSLDRHPPLVAAVPGQGERVVVEGADVVAHGLQALLLHPGFQHRAMPPEVGLGREAVEAHHGTLLGGQHLELHPGVIGLRQAVAREGPRHHEAHAPAAGNCRALGDGGGHGDLLARRRRGLRDRRRHLDLALTLVAAKDVAGQQPEARGARRTRVALHLHVCHEHRLVLAQFESAVCVQHLVARFFDGVGGGGHEQGDGGDEALKHGGRPPERQQPSPAGDGRHTRAGTAYLGSTTLSMTWMTPLSAAILDVLGHDLAGHDVVGQHGGELGLVLQQRLQVGLRDLGEGGVGGREHRERARALQGVDQAGRLQGGRQGLEVAGGNGGVDDVLGLGAGGSQGESGEGEDHLVDDVDDAVAGEHVSRGDVGAAGTLVGDGQARVHGEGVALQRGDRGVHRHVGLEHAARHDVVGQHGHQQRLVGQQRFLGDAQLGQQRGERVIRRCEHGQRARRCQRVLQARGDDGLDQDAELRQRDGRLHDVLVGRQQHLVERVDDAVLHAQVGEADVGAAVAAVSDDERAGIGIDLEDATGQGRDGLAHRHLARQHLAAQHVVLQHGGQQRLVGQQLVLGDTQFGQQRSEGVVGGREHRQRTGRGERVLQAGGHDRLDQDAELRHALQLLHQGALTRQGHVAGQDDLVDGVDDAVARERVGAGDGGLATQAVGDGEARVDREGLAFHRGDGGTHRHIGLEYAARHDVIGQDLAQQRLVRKQGLLADAQLGQGRGEGGIGRREHRERAVARQRALQVGGDDGLHQRAEGRSDLRGLHDVFVGRQQHLVDDVQHAVGRDQVGLGDAGLAVAAVGHDERARLAVDLEEAAAHRRDGLAERHGTGPDFARQHVVLQHGRQQRLVGQQLRLGEVEFGQQRAERGIGRREHGVGAGAAQGRRQVGRRDGFGQHAEPRVTARQGAVIRNNREGPQARGSVRGRQQHFAQAVHQAVAAGLVAAAGQGQAHVAAAQQAQGLQADVVQTQRAQAAGPGQFAAGPAAGHDVIEQQRPQPGRVLPERCGAQPQPGRRTVQAGVTGREQREGPAAAQQVVQAAAVERIGQARKARVGRHALPERQAGGSQGRSMACTRRWCRSCGRPIRRTARPSASTQPGPCSARRSTLPLSRGSTPSSCGEARVRWPRSQRCRTSGDISAGRSVAASRAASVGASRVVPGGACSSAPSEAWRSASSSHWQPGAGAEGDGGISVVRQVGNQDIQALNMQHLMQELECLQCELISSLIPASPRRRHRRVGEPPAGREGLRSHDGGRGGGRRRHRESEPLQALHVQGRIGRRRHGAGAGPSPGGSDAAAWPGPERGGAPAGRGPLGLRAADGRPDAGPAFPELHAARDADRRQGLHGPADAAVRRPRRLDRRGSGPGPAEPGAAAGAGALHAVRPRLRPGAGRHARQRCSHRRTDRRLAGATCFKGLAP
ncbi:hypothetical protein Lal_00010358 [Lupinus albus]|nr:hypothetical protein Lal_00010358 [Lupinus albus]